MATLRTLIESDLAHARTLVRDAFAAQDAVLPGPSAGHPVLSPWQVEATWRTTPAGSFVLEEGEVYGVGQARILGQVGVIGPIAVRPDRQGCGHGRALLQACLGHAQNAGCLTIGLETFPHGLKHFALYTEAGFIPTAHIAVMCRELTGERRSGTTTMRTLPGSRVVRWSKLELAERNRALLALTDLCRAYRAGYDPTVQCDVVAGLHLGDTLILQDRDGIAGFVICLGGPGGAAKKRGLWVHTLVVRQGDRAMRLAERLVAASEQLAEEWGEPRIGLPVQPTDRAVLDWLRDEDYTPELMLTRMERGTPPTAVPAASGVLWDDWR